MSVNDLFSDAPDAVCGGCWIPLYSEEALTSPPSPFFFCETCYGKYGDADLFCGFCMESGRARPATYYAAQQGYQTGKAFMWATACDDHIVDWNYDAEPNNPAPVFKLVRAESPISGPVAVPS